MIAQGCRSLRRHSKPTTQRRAAPLVAQRPATEKPRRSGAKSAMWAAEKGGGNAAHTKTLPQNRLHSARGTLARKSRAGAGLSSSKRGLPLGGKPTNAIAQFCTSMSRLAGHLCLPTQRAVTHSTKVTSKPAQSTGRLTLGCTARGRSQKKPRQVLPNRLAELRHPANPSRQYHSCARPQKKPRRSGAKFGRSIVMGLPCEAANPPTQRGRRIIGCTPRLRTRVASVAAPLR
jgi:hypothetical protein